MPIFKTETDALKGMVEVCLCWDFHVELHNSNYIFISELWKFLQGSGKKYSKRPEKELEGFWWPCLGSLWIELPFK